MKFYFYRLALIIILSSIFLSWSSLFASKVFAADVGIEIINPPLVPTLPSPGDNLSIDVIAYNFLNVRQTAIVEVNVTPGEYIVDPDTQRYEVSLAPMGSDTRTLTFGVTSNVCQTGSVPFVATATIYVGAINWGSDTSSTTLSDGIGATLNVNVNVSASMNLRRNDGGDTRSASGTSANFRRLNCNYSYTLTTSTAGYTTNVRTINSGAGPDPKVCNGQETATTVTLVVAPSPTPTPTPTSGPTPTPGGPTPTPTPTPGPKTASLTWGCPGGTATLYPNWDVGSGSNCNAYIQAGDVPHVISTDCDSGGQRTIQDSSYIWDGGIYQLHVGDPDGGTTSSSQVTIDCDIEPPPPPPPPGEYPPPYFQIFWEVANITKGESIPSDCGEGSSPGCDGDWGGWRYWPPSCSNRLIKQTTTASLGNEIQVRACFRRMGGDSRYNRDASLKFWLNLAEPGYIPLGNAGQDWQVRNAFGGWGSISPSSGNYQYNNATSTVPYIWLGTTEDLDNYIQNCGSPGDGDDYWEYGCVREVRYKFNIKNDSELANKTVSAKGWLSISPAVNPYSFHMYLTSCNTGNDLYSLGFWNRTPYCCWGQPFYRNDIDGWPGCPIPESDPKYNNCRYGPCDQGINPIEENFVFWSNWIRINVRVIAPWIQVTGDVHSNVRINAPGGP